MARPRSPARRSRHGPLNLYEGPSHHYSILDEVPQGAVVDLAGCNGAWCKITFARRAGYLPAEIVARAIPAQPAGGLLPRAAAALVRAGL